MIKQYTHERNRTTTGNATFSDRPFFLSIPESKQNLSEMEKFRVGEEITPSKLGFVKMMGADKKQPAPKTFGVFTFWAKPKSKIRLIRQIHHTEEFMRQRGGKKSPCDSP